MILYHTNCIIQKWVVLWSICKRSNIVMLQYSVQYVKNNLTNDILWWRFLQNGWTTSWRWKGTALHSTTRAYHHWVVRENNAIRLHELQQRIIANRNVFNNINRVSISTLSYILQKHKFRMKKLYRVPFERNSVRVKDLRHDYVQVCVTLLYILYIVMWDWGCILPPASPVACSFCLYWLNPAHTCVKI